MAVRALHPIVLAGVLLALPAVVAWSPGGPLLSKKKEAPAAVPEPPIQTSIVLPIEISEQGAAPVRKRIEVKLETVPEPSSLLLLSAGSLLLLRRRRSD